MVDASVFVEYLLPGRREEECRDLLEDPATELLVPDLVYPEVVNAFRKMMMRGQLAPEEVSGLLEDLVSLPLTSFPSRSLIPAMGDHLAALTAYDACYMTLASERRCSLATFDRSLGIAARAASIPTPLD